MFQSIPSVLSDDRTIENSDVNQSSSREISEMHTIKIADQTTSTDMLTIDTIIF
jgi:hypothetical protein